MVLVYMAGNLAMKSATTPILAPLRFPPRADHNGGLCCVLTLACGLLQQLCSG